MDSTDPDVSVTPISYALSNHRNVHDKLASYGHAWSTIDIFFKCVVSRRLQQLRDAPKSMPSLPMQHVIIPQSLKAGGGGGRLGTSAFEFLQTIFSGPAVQLQVHRAKWVPICFAQHRSGCCTSNASVAVPQAVAVAAILLRGDADELSGLLQGENATPPSSRTLTVSRVAMSILGACASTRRLRSYTTLCVPRAPGTTADGLDLDNLTDLGGLHGAGVLEGQVGLAQLNVDEVHNTYRSSTEDWVQMRAIAWANVAAAEPSEHLVLWASSEGPSNGRLIVHETAAVSRVRNFLAERWPSSVFAHKRLMDLSVRQEIRLLRRTAVFITLFGSSEHHCRWLPPGAIVLEIRGAMKNDFADIYTYPDLCARSMGLRWTGLTTPGHVPAVQRSQSGIITFGEHLRRDDYFKARLDPDELIATLDLALRGNFSASLHRFAANIDWISAARQRRFAEQLLQLPQYNTPSLPI